MSPRIRRPKLTTVSLVRKGYFPRELPPPFTTSSLAELVSAQRSALYLDTAWTEPSRHNLARLSGFRRPLKIPNPRSYINLCDVLERQWSDIAAHCKKENLAISRPVVTRTVERAVRPRFRLGEGPKLRARMWRGQRFVLRSDVSQFYPSLYTHAIPWALHTKAEAKAKKGKTKGDKIDKALRESASGQTIGIAIGPDASFVVAEIVLTAVDELLRKKLGKVRGWRYLDDYELAFGSRAAAEEAQFFLESALGDFELVINPFKTHVLELPQPFKDSWTHDLLTFPIRTGSSGEILNDTIALFSLAAEVARRHPGALKYALLKSKSLPLSSGAWKTFQGLVWGAVSAEPTTMATALDLLEEQSGRIGKRIDRTGAAEVLEPLVLKHAPLRNGSEVAWAIWAALRLNVRLSKNAASAISAMDDNVVALLALDAEAHRLFPKSGLDHSNWEASIDNDDVLSGAHWLLAYEATIKGWLTSATMRVSKDRFFSLLQKHDVYFYEPDPSRDPFTGPSGPLPGAPLPESYL